MRNPIVVVGLGILGLAGFSLFAGWAFFATQRLGQGWRDLAPIWPYVAGAVVIVAAMTAFFMWLAFYSANHRYDERVGREEGPWPAHVARPRSPRPASPSPRAGPPRR